MDQMDLVLVQQAGLSESHQSDQQETLLRCWENRTDNGRAQLCSRALPHLLTFT